MEESHTRRKFTKGMQADVLCDSAHMKHRRREPEGARGGSQDARHALLLELGAGYSHVLSSGKLIHTFTVCIVSA